MRYIISPTNDSRSSWIRTNTISAIYHRSSLPIELLSDETGLLLEAKKPLERTPHFFEPGVGECVNALGQLEQIIGFEPIPVVWKTTVLTANTISAYKRLSFQTAISVRESEELRRTKMRGLPSLRRASPGYNTTW